jgi:hypothetical protein
VHGIFTGLVGVGDAEQAALDLGQVVGDDFIECRATLARRPVVNFIGNTE